jgi:hypothetical protein
VVGSPSTKISSLTKEAADLNDAELLNAVKETFNEDIGLKLDTTNSDVKNSNVNLPNINIDSNSSSDNSMNQYFTEPVITQQDIKSRFSNLFNQITQRRDESNVTGSPNISQLGLSPKLSPLNTKPSISNLFDDTTALFEDDDDLPISNIDKGKAKEVDENLLSNVIND